jgi:ERCC4-type nuclease
MKKPLANIFSRTKPEKEPACPNPKVPIIIDTREKPSLITANLVEQKANIKSEKLEVGDYLIGNTAIERKTFSDFVGSMLNKRLITQLDDLKKYPKHFLILEGFDYNYEKFNVHKNAIKGMLLSVATDFKVPIIFTEDEADTASFLILTAKKYEKPKVEFGIRQSRTLKSLDEQKQFILEGFPGIGPTTAKSLLGEFGSLKKIFGATENKLKAINKLDENKIKRFKDLLND